MQQSLITVGLPVHNAMPYLPEAMESLMAQQYSGFEILAIVDGGADGSLEYLRSLQARPSMAGRLQILTQENRGVTATLNRMLRECRTQWLVRSAIDSRHCEKALPDPTCGPCVPSGP